MHCSSHDSQPTFCWNLQKPARHQLREPAYQSERKEALAIIFFCWCTQMKISDSGEIYFLLHVRCLCAKVNHYLQAQSFYKLKNRGNDVNCVFVFEIPDSLANHVAHIDNHQLLRDGLVAV